MPTQPCGGAFIYAPVLSEQVFTPEQFSSTHLEVQKTAQDFIKNEVEPRVESIDHKKPGVVTDLFRKASELGLFMVEVPEVYGGLGLDKATGMLVAESVSHVGSFAVTMGAHTGIGTLPVLYYGTEEQRQRYIPQLATGQWMGAYALSEPGSGSDALGAKTTAKLSSDGTHYVLNGTKQWITNAAWADVFTVFAQIEGEHFSAFIVERTMPGVSIGKEERKLGIRGSSTCQLILDDVRVPVGNLLGQVGKGHKIAFNILNIGRWKLGVGAVGTCKYALSLGVKYAKERRQFKKAISTFGLIRQKIAHSMVLIYAGESMAYRLAGAIDARTALLDKNHPEYYQQAIKIIDEFTIEASVLKIFGSEALHWVADEMLQVHGGNGYTEDYPIERVVRDARINRIFEGTNEINRLIIPATLLKRALKGTLPLLQYTGQVMSELNNPETLPQKGTGVLASEIWATELAKRAVVYAASYAAQKYMEDLKSKQHLLGVLADCLIDVYAMDSVVARAHQTASETHLALCKLYCFDARANVFQRLRRAAMMMADGEELDMLYDYLGKLDQRYRVDYMGLQEHVASHALEADGYRL
jgi:alkylation response protein AidB-like acyl-CoA dehydrogenase